MIFPTYCCLSLFVSYKRAETCYLSLQIALWRRAVSRLSFLNIFSCSSKCNKLLRDIKGRKDHFHTFSKSLPENQLLPIQHFRTEAAVPFPWVFSLLAAWVLCSVQIAPDNRTLLCPRFSIAAFTKYDPVAPAVTFTMFSGKMENAIFPTWLCRLKIINNLGKPEGDHRRWQIQ